MNLNINTTPFIIDFSKIFTIQNLVIYLIVINILAFLFMWIDKRKAEKGKWRISEAALLTLSLLGGGIGSLAGMYTFRHKTKKLRFTVGIPIILIFEIIVLAYFLIK